jgi:predicted SprT family Zn-dependent metalloprotease
MNEGKQVDYEYDCKICGKKGKSREMTYRRQYDGYVHRKCINKLEFWSAQVENMKLR